MNYRCSGPALEDERCGSVPSKPPRRPGNMETGNGSAQDAWGARVKGVLRSRAPQMKQLLLLSLLETAMRMRQEYWLLRRR
jgi:hypothetical protein